jgi:four helix bundle protein
MQDGFKSLIVWQKSIVLAQGVYQLTDLLPTRENYALADQMRRSAVSVPSNIAEGSRRGGKKDYAHFVSIAHGSLAELETQVLIAANRYPKIPFSKLEPSIDEISRMLLVLGRRLRG